MKRGGGGVERGRVHLADGDRRMRVSAGNDYHVEKDAAASEMEEQASASSKCRLNADIVESRRHGESY